jgi:MFS family permease
MALWGIGMGAQESILRAAIAGMIAPEQRGTAYGLFNMFYGVAWFLGSLLLGILYDRALPWMILFSVTAQLLAIPILASLRRSHPLPG